MAIVNVKVSHIEMEGDYGNSVDGVRVSCTLCKRTVEIYGTSGKSIARGCITLRNRCPDGSQNFYQQAPKNRWAKS